MRNFIKDREKFLNEKAKLEEEISSRSLRLDFVTAKIKELDNIIALSEKYEKTISFTNDRQS